MHSNKEKQEDTCDHPKLGASPSLRDNFGSTIQWIAPVIVTPTEPGATAGLLKLRGDHRGRRDKLNGIDI